MATTQFRSAPSYLEQMTPGNHNNSNWYRYFQQNELGTPPSGETVLTVQGSPFSYTALAKGFVIVTGGTVSNVSFSRTQNVFYTTGQTQGMFPMSQNDIIKVFYSGLAPKLVWVPT